MCLGICPDYADVDDFESDRHVDESLEKRDTLASQQHAIMNVVFIGRSSGEQLELECSFT